MAAGRPRFKAFKYDGSGPMPGKAYVYDYEAGMIARGDDGKLIWTKTFAEAKRCAGSLNEREP